MASSSTNRKSSTSKDREPVAIIGIGCRYPGDANSAQEFWQMLLDKTDALIEIPPDRWDVNAMYDPDFNRSGKISVRRGGFIRDIDRFDAGFFGISPMEAQRIDPQHRILLETTYQAIEDAGLKLDDLSGSRSGVFIGISAHDYGDIQNTPIEQVNIGAHTNTGGAQSIASNRISYIFNLRGPSFSVDTACSSSLVAIHLALKSIWNGESDLAFAGGVNAILKPEPEMGFSKGGFLSPDGRCKSFDSRANGYIRSEGTGIIILKPYSKAVEDRDPIYALIRGSAINQDGATNGITVPNGDAQKEMLVEAYEDAGVTPGKLGYVEAHGTGTSVGDPIEAKSIGSVIGAGRTDKCFIGSVKSNIGHLEPASGIAGITKLALAIKHKKIPPNVHFKKPNPDIPFDELNLQVPTKVEDYPLIDGKIFGGVNSFGFGGANAHLVLEGLTDAEPAGSAQDAGVQILTISARDEGALKDFSDRYIEFLTDKGNKASLRDIAYSSSVRRTHHTHRLAVSGETKDEIIENLKAWQGDEARTGMSSGRAAADVSGAVFVFSGQGPQWWAMGRQLLDNTPVFRAKVEEISKLLEEHAEWNLMEELTAEQSASRINETNIAQPCIFALQIGLAEVWKSMGVQPSAVVGHSIGEVAAAHVSGALSLKEAVRVIYHRSRVQAKGAGKGKMLAVGLSHEDAKKEIVGKEDLINIAAVNGPAMLTLAGDTDALEDLAEELDEKDIFHRFLRVNVPFHSFVMEPLKDELISSLEGLSPQTATIPHYSTVTGGRIDGNEVDTEYWYKNVRYSVLFTDATKALLDDGYNTFIEISPHPVLAQGMEDMIANEKKKGVIIPSLRRKENEKMTLMGALGTLYSWGYDVDWSAMYDDECIYVKLPFYPWQRERYWLETEEGRRQRLGVVPHPHLTRAVSSAREKDNILWDIVLDKRTYPYIEDHRVQGPIVFPGAGHVELALSAAINSFGDSFEFLEDINFKAAMFLPDEGEPPLIQMDISHDRGDYFLYTKPRNSEAPWSLCSNGKVNHIADNFITEDIDLVDVRKRVNIEVPVEKMQQILIDSGLQLGPTFCSMKKLWRTDTEAYSEVVVNETIRAGFEKFNLHPAILDSCFQTMFGVFFQKEEQNEKMGVYIPIHIDRVKFHRKPGTHKLYAYGRCKIWTDELAGGDLWIFNEKDELVAEFQGFLNQFLKGSRGEVAGEADSWFYQYNWNMKARADQESVRDPGEYLLSPTQVAPKVNKLITDIIKRPLQKEYYEHFEPDLKRLVFVYIASCLRELGLEFEKGMELDLDDLAEKFLVIDAHRRLFSHMFAILSTGGIVEGAENKWTVKKVPENIDPQNMLEDMNRRFHQFSQELTLLGRCGPELKGVLQGTADPIQLIFPEDKWDDIVKYYVEGFSFKKYNDISAKAIHELIRKVPEERSIRILEIGAGTGGMTQAILKHLPPDRTEYYYTDLSHVFMVKAQQRFSRFPFVQYKVLDIEKDPGEQGFDLNSFDMVLGSDVIHATRKLSDTLDNVKKLLASEGIFMMLEVTNTPTYLDLIFGMTEGWWLFEDTDIRPNHATMPPATWHKVLGDNGFSDVVNYSDYPGNEESAQQVILARAPKLKLNKKPLSQYDKADKADWLIFADDGGIAKKAVARLAKFNKDVITVYKGSAYKEVSDSEVQIVPDSQDDMNKVVDMIKAQGNFQGILFLWAIDNPDNEKLDLDAIESSEKTSSYPLMNLMKKLNEEHFDKNPEIWMVSSGAQCVSGSPATVKLSQAGFRGVSRVVINEFPLFPSTMVDLSSPVSDKELDVFIDEIIAGDNEDEIAFRGRKRYINKLERVTSENAEQKAKKKVTAEGYPFSTSITEYGVLDNLIVRETERTDPGDDEIEIQIKSAALNFRDIMIAMGLLSEDAIKGGLFGKNFGLECSGKVVRKGKKVKDFKIGDDVFAFTPKSLSGFAIARACQAVKKPKKLSWQEAAGLPVVYLTAWYALMYHCRMAKGERILIHAAAGGVGIAAIQLAKAVGAEIYATVGSPEKVKYIKSLGVPAKNIFNSRSLHFADELMRATKGKGVDIVLNSLSGPAIYKSIRCLAPYGRFVEIGKTDIYRNSKVGLEPFGNNLAYFAVDIDRLLEQKIEFSGQLFRECMDYFSKNKFIPHPVKDFPISEVSDAFLFMAGARHIGKVTVSMAGDVLVSPPAEISFHKDATYLVTGGNSGFGLQVAKWMAAKGAGNLVLISRSGPKTDVEKAVIKDIQKSGVKVKVAKCDVTSKAAVTKLMADIKKTMPPVKGIQHAAMVIDDASIPETDFARYMKVFKPKVYGAWNLHEAVKKMKLEHFIQYSSISAIYGNPGQVNYTAANHFLDNFSQFRRSSGKASTTINWGALGDVGFLADNKEVEGLLAKQGWYTFNLRQSTMVLEKMLLQNPVQRVATDTDWEKVSEFFPAALKTSRFSALMREKELASSSAGAGGDGALKATLLESSDEEKHEILQSQLRDTIARILGMASDKLDVNDPVTKMGLDSLMANQIRNWIQGNIGIDYSMMRIMRGPTLVELTQQLIDELTGEGEEGEGEESGEGAKEDSKEEAVKA